MPKNLPTRLEDWFAYQARTSLADINLSLERCIQAVARLQLKPPPYQLISVAGTNGKGSCVSLLSAIYQAAGFRVGQCTSPHLLDYRERFQLNGEWISEAEICRLFQRLATECADIPLTRFECDTLAAYVWFAEQAPDVVIMEVGLGGRLDAVNVLDADASIITNISLDHCNYLGNTREAIALEKAGILRQGQISAYAEANPPTSLVQYAKAQKVDLQYLEQDFSSASLAGFELAPYWQSAHQQQNAAAVLNIVERLQTRLAVKQADIATALAHAQLAGRLQWLNRQCLLDVAHNPAAAQALAAYLQTQPCQGQTHALVSMLADKDIASTLALLHSQIDVWHTAALNVERAASLTQMQAGLSFSQTLYSYDSVSHAYSQIQAQLAAEDRLIVFGSFHTVAAVLQA